MMHTLIRSACAVRPRGTMEMRGVSTPCCGQPGGKVRSTKAAALNDVSTVVDAWDCTSTTNASWTCSSKQWDCTGSSVGMSTLPPRERGDAGEGWPDCGGALRNMVTLADMRCTLTRIVGFVLARRFLTDILGTQHNALSTHDTHPNADTDNACTYQDDVTASPAVVCGPWPALGALYVARTSKTLAVPRWQSKNASASSVSLPLPSSASNCMACPAVNGPPAPRLATEKNCVSSIVENALEQHAHTHARMV